MTVDDLDGEGYTTGKPHWGWAVLIIAGIVLFCGYKIIMWLSTQTS
jgi:hypothetical protein